MAIELKPRNLIKLQWPPPNSSPYKVQDNESWGSVASKVNLTVKDLIVFNFGTDRPAEINWYLNHYVGCPETPDKRNRMFSSSAKPGYIYYPTIRITIQPDTIITGDPRKSKARVLVQQFAANPSTGVWPYLARCQVAQQLMARIEAPYLINQGNAGLCPSAGVVYALASSRPDEYVKTVIDLYDMGRTQINNWKIEPTSDLKKYWVPGSTPAADWIILASIRDSENWFIDYQAETDGGGAWGGEVANWLRKAGFTTVIEEWNYVCNKDETHLRRADTLNESRHQVCLLIHAEMLVLAGQCARTGWTFKPNHWVVLASRISFGGFGSKKTVSMTVFILGERLPIPQPHCAPIYLSDFLQHYYGFVACKF